MIPYRYIDSMYIRLFFFCRNLRRKHCSVVYSAQRTQSIQVNESNENINNNNKDDNITLKSRNKQQNCNRNTFWTGGCAKKASKTVH